MEFLILGLIIWAISELVSWIIELLNYGHENLPEPNINDILSANYHPEECDKRMCQECQTMLEEYFKEPAGAPLHVRIAERMRGMTPSQKKDFLKELTSKASRIMHVKLDNIVFENISSMGYYDPSQNTMAISNAYFELNDANMAILDQANVELVKTIFHELKHAVQYNALNQGLQNDWGYSEGTLISWANNFQSYINYHIDPEGYYTQPIEVDSFGFECGIIPTPGLGMPRENTAA